jgi:hypothetical protein
VRKGTGEGPVEDIGEHLPTDGDGTRRFIGSVRGRLLSNSSEAGLRGLFSEADGEARLRVDETDPRCEAGGCGEGSACRLPLDTVGERRELLLVSVFGAGISGAR